MTLVFDRIPKYTLAYSSFTASELVPLACAGSGSIFHCEGFTSNHNLVCESEYLIRELGNWKWNSRPRPFPNRLFGEGPEYCYCPSSSRKAQIIWSQNPCHFDSLLLLLGLTQRDPFLLEDFFLLVSSLRERQDPT